MSEETPTILFVEDNLAILEAMSVVLRRRGYRLLTASRPDEALQIIRSEHRIDLMITDLQLPMQGSLEIGAQESAGGLTAGLVLAQEARRRFRRLPIIFWSMHFGRDVRLRIREMGSVHMVSKTSGDGPVLDILQEVLEGFTTGRRPRCFIVHGHDEATKKSVRDYLVDRLGFPEPVILREMPAHGMAIMDKLETYAPTIDLVFVLLTPDDKVISPHAEARAEVFRSRQNVIFELGFFLGVMGRATGRVIMLYRHPTELPSDIGGLISIDITNGMESAASEIEREIEEWL